MEIIKFNRNFIKIKDLNLILKIVLILFLSAWFSIFILQKIDLTTSDLGRHIKNGEMVLKGNFGVLKTNFYSYTEPQYFFLNHHWLSGVIFYLIFKIINFKGLHLLYLIFYILTFLMFFILAYKISGFKNAFLFSLFLIPLVTYRKEIRPEIFSYLFSGLFFYVLWLYQKELISKKYLFVLPAVVIFWVNLHIYFILGFALIGIFLFENLLLKNKEKIKTLILVLVLSVVGALITPFGVRGLIYPFRIFQNYGYKLVENQSVLFLENLNFYRPEFLIFKIVLILTLLSFILVLIKSKKSFVISNFILICFLGIWTFFAIRNITLFGFFALPVLSYNFKIFEDNLREKFKFVFKFLFLILIFVLIIFSYFKYFSFYKNSFNFGLGILDGNNLGGLFLKANKILGPIFNNYDIGSYLIYYLYPKEKVFVDNRPEAYSESFFKDIYILMQENEEIWQFYDKKHDFNAIVFGYHDLTPWAQNFLAKRINDLKWAPVFVDNYIIIFLKRNEINKDIILKYELPKEIFNVKSK